VVQIRQLADKILYSSKATMHIYSHTKFVLFYLNYFLTYKGGPKNPRLHRGGLKAPPSGENYHLC